MEETIRISDTMMSQMNFSLQQNYVPIFRNITISNTSDKDIENLTVSVRFEPEFAYSFSAVIDKLEASKSFEISPVSISISSEYLRTLTEKVSGNVFIEVFNADGLLTSKTNPIDVLAINQWTGVNLMPEMITSLVTPNHPVIKEVTSKAAGYLQKWTKDPSFTAYQTQNPNNVKLQMAAVYAALQETNIAYIVSPPSYENAQRVRLADEVINGKAGNCLDLSVLYCSCLEYIGLKPILVFTEGHAFAGCHLEDDTFSDCIIYDSTAITKRAAQGIDEICLVECTAFTAGKSCDFDASSRQALQTAEKQDDFIFAVDVSRCRGSGIRPIPTGAEANEFENNLKARKKNEITGAPEEMKRSLINVDGDRTIELTKQDLWERKLLDMSLRNSLISFRPSSSNIQIMSSDIAGLEDKIANGDSFKIMPVPSDSLLKAADSKIFETENNKDIIASISENEFKSHRLRTFINESELEKSLKKLHRDSKLSLEENGVNTLYLALGFLKWYETEKSEKPRYAPLILVPIDIIKKIQDKSYSIKIRDEETQINITIIEFLRQTFGIEIGGLVPLPEDESGIDITLVLNTIRRAIMSKQKWNVEEYAFIGSFSFSRFIMWNDIKNRSEELKKNKVVSSLMSGKMEWEAEDLDISALELDKNVAPNDMAVPTSADSSQLAAIYAASKDQSFVLHGPPGTGKSQTITNMIANALYNGKSVLFIAEKMAALSVVQSRLAKIGLDKFSLELHSNKAQKRAVLNQLENTLNVGRIKEPEQYKAEADEIYALRSELNSILENIHKKRNYGMSVYDAIVRYQQNSAYDDKIKLNTDIIISADENTYDNISDAIRDICECDKECSYASSPLKICKSLTYSIEMRDKLKNILADFKEKALRSNDDISSLAEYFNGIPFSYSNYKAENDILNAALSCDGFISELITDENYDIVFPALKNLVNKGKERAEIKNSVEQICNGTIWSYDITSASLKYKDASQKWALSKALGQSKLIKELNLHSKTGKYFTKDNIEQFYNQILHFNELEKAINETDGKSVKLIGSLWMGCASDFNSISTLLDGSAILKSAISALPVSMDRKAGITDSIKNICKNESDSKKAKAITINAKQVISAINELSESFGIDIVSLCKGDNWAKDSASKAEKAIMEISELKDIVAANVAISKLKELNMADLAESFEQGELSGEELQNAFDCAFGKAAALVTLGNDPALNEFRGAKLEDTISKFKEALTAFEELTIKELVAKLSAKIPSTGTASASAEVNTLLKAIKSGGRMLPIRKLFDSIPNLLRRMCPCMLMSPISVAQYIDPSFPKFDLVIFDEASQLPTCEAVGAIARGENVIVVGDPKQLPPTSFFAANTIDEENYEKEDLESVLDDCLALAMPQKHLLWHYRSRHESLIAYSNAKYYENKLLTFPSPGDLVSQVKWVKVEGFYDKGSSKQNKAEAQAVVNEIIRRLKDEKLSKESIGVVTFSLVQQILIDDLLTEEFRKNPELEQTANKMYEPLFIKNLENVQGDERDVILFSVGYGPDKNGKVSMNFGPLNRDGGWRRLNVAISRSRKEMIVYSVITPDQIDMTRTRSEGVAGLKGFLEFAALGKETLAKRGEQNAEASGFEKIVSEEINKLGYDVRCNVGCSEYKVDIAVINPDDKNSYILGISCDNRRRLSGGTARDRTVLQPSVLKGLGWNIMNVYIIDWLDNKEKVIEKIKTQIESCIESFRNGNNEEETKQENPKREITFEKQETLPASSRCEKYVQYFCESKGTPESFLDSSERTKITTCINDVLSTEAPIAENLLFKRVISLWGITKSTASVKNAYDEAYKYSKAIIKTSYGINYCMTEEMISAPYTKCRIPSEGAEKRTMDVIMTEEIANGVKLIMDEQLSLSYNELVKETAKLFGFTRMGAVIEKACAKGIDCADKHGFIIVDGDKVSVQE